MEAVRTSETSVDNHFTRQYNPEDNSEHHTRRRENLKYHKLQSSLSAIRSQLETGTFQIRSRSLNLSTQKYGSRLWPQDEGNYHSFNQELKITSCRPTLLWHPWALPLPCIICYGFDEWLIGSSRPPSTICNDEGQSNLRYSCEQSK
jgi:hypothetical protein